MDIQYLMRQAKKLEKAMADAREKLSATSRSTRSPAAGSSRSR